MTSENRRTPATPLPSDPSFGAIPTDAVQYQLKVYYPGRMHPNRVETIKVALSPLQPVNRALDLGRKKPSCEIPVRLVIPGAVLLPAEQTLEPTPFGAAEATFHVTPLAEGRLPDCRLEVFRHGKVEAIPLPLRSQSHRALAWLIALTVLIPLLLFLPSCWPGVAESHDVEWAVTSWFPTSPTAVSRGAQSAYAFLATTGRNLKLSFFTFLTLLGLTALWAASRRPTVETASNEPFFLMPPPSPTRASPLAPLLIPASTDDFGDVRR